MQIVHEVQLKVCHEVSYRELVRGGPLQHCHPAVTEANFPPAGLRGVERIGVALVSFSTCMRMFRVLRESEQRGYQRSTVHQLLTLVSQAQYVPSFRSITALMPFWDCPHTGLEFAVRICQQDRWSSVDIVPCESCWYPDDLFLVAVP